ncbi:granzyme B(G,H)-like [Pleuronectes platessa]|uniref:granzyme B(G,H)-like n=1 Tax=Pleuronectes platessa TaxID=8262 RepID=UPI00232A0F18|nr:granzyme B(G,H)-like [Pleuronectes platessa]
MIQTIGIIFFFQLFSLNGATESGIFGGKVSKPHSRPYMASLQFDGHHSCGGILVRDDFVLTSAHCYNSQMTMMVVLGAHNIIKKEKSQQNLQVADYFTHPEYNGKYDYDIMLLKLKNKAKLNKYVKPIGLPKKNGKTPANVACVVAGWGYVAAKGPASHVLRETKEKIQFPAECKQIWKGSFNSNHMICTKFDKKKGGICQGDSGGPLICNSKPQGITAYTYKNDCEKPNHPHVFMNLHFFLPWIKKTMQG